MTTDTVRELICRLGEIAAELQQLEARQLAADLPPEHHAELLIAATRVSAWAAGHLVAIARDCDEPVAAGILAQVRARRALLNASVLSAN